MLTALILAAASPAAPPPRPSCMRPESRAQAQACVAEQFKRIDRDGDGVVTREEALAMTPKGAPPAARLNNVRPDPRKLEGETAAPPAPRGRPDRAGALVGAIFDRMDGNRNGKVTLAEAQATALAYYDRADSNGDGMLSDAERQAAMPSRRPRP